MKQLLAIKQFNLFSLASFFHFTSVNRPPSNSLRFEKRTLSQQA